MYFYYNWNYCTIMQIDAIKFELAKNMYILLDIMCCSMDLEDFSVFVNIHQHRKRLNN